MFMQICGDREQGLHIPNAFYLFSYEHGLSLERGDTHVKQTPVFAMLYKLFHDTTRLTKVQ